MPGREVQTTSKIVIVGAGCFGLSTAYHLFKRGFKDITILDRSETLPAPDAASCDLNKIVRSSYADIYYARLAREAIEEWKSEAEWKDTYHECGVLVLGAGEDTYTDLAYVNDANLGARIQKLASPDSIKAVFPPGVPTAPFDGLSGFLNHDGGWAFAAQGIQLLIDKVTVLGGRVLPGKPVVGLVKDGAKTKGVECADGTVYDADLVVIASGSWTASTFVHLGLGEKCLATGQSVALIQLTHEEAERYRDCPVYLDFGSGFYAFPPNKDNIVKLAIHASGHTFTQPINSDSSSTPVVPDVSTPRTSLSHGEEGLRIPKDVAQALRESLRKVYPELAAKPFSGTRLCWYTDSPDENWIIGYHPTDAGLVLATAGSGHAYKFLPNIGRLVADAIQGLEPTVLQRFALDRQGTAHALSRDGQQPKELDLSQLCAAEDLLP